MKIVVDKWHKIGYFLLYNEALIRQYEGVSALPYEDSVGKITIGIGRNLTDRGLSVDEVEMLFANDMKIAAEIFDIWCHD